MKTETSDPSPAGTIATRPKKRWLRRGAIILVSLASLTALFYAVENWRGARVWAATLEDLKARGAKMSLEDFKETPIPDDQNMVMHPAFRCFTFTRPDGTRARRLDGDQPDPQDAAMAAKWAKLMNPRLQNEGSISELYDLWDAPKPDREALRPTLEKVKTVLARHEELLTAIRGACGRPGCQWPIRAGSGMEGSEVTAPMNSMNIFMPLIECAHLLTLHSFVCAAEGRAEEAWGDIGCFGPLSACGRKLIPTIMSSLLSAAIEGNEAGAVGRLLENAPAGPETYAVLEKNLSLRLPSADSLVRAAEGQRAWFVSLCLWTFQSKSESESLKTVRESGGDKLPPLWLIPSGWFRQNAVADIALDTGMLKLLQTSEPPAARIEALKRYLDTSSAASKNSPYQYLAHGAASVYAGISSALLRIDCQRALLRTALLCAQQRAATGKTPMSLDDLSPELKARVPHSPIHGDPPVISRDEAGLWSLNYKALGESLAPDDLSLKLRGW